MHDYSPRAGAPFVALNCGAIPQNLLESELFGHVKGAFTGASSDRDGAAARANGGTLFLDEITEMDISLQPKLLRFLQLGVFQKVGGDKTIETDIRIVAATNRDPLECVREGLLREDLYYRLNVLPVELPSLRQRSGDIEKIAQAFLTQYAAEEGKTFTGFASAAMDAFSQHPWPGNVRELQNVIRQIVVLNDGPVVEFSMAAPLLSRMVSGLKEAAPDTESRVAGSAGAASSVGFTPKPLWRIELDAIDDAVAYCNGNIQKASQLLDISPSTIYRKRERARLRAPDAA